MYAIKIAVCDDEQRYIDRLVNHIELYGDEGGAEFKITEYKSGRKLIEDIMADSKMYDIVFLDVEMPEIDGLKTAKAIRKMSEDIILCFVTGHEQYTREAYQVEALGYIVKPVAYNKLKKLLRRAVIIVNYEQEHRKLCERYIEVPVSGDKRIIDARTIRYIEKNKNQSILHFSDSEIICYESLKKMYSRLDNELFVYSHQGYIVNFNEIKEVKENVICLGRNVEVPVSRRRYKEVRDRHLNRVKQQLEEKYCN